MATRTKVAIFGAALVLAAAVVVGGYAFHWGWTGFPGNTLWDWLNLLLLPVSLAFLPLAFDMPQAVLAKLGAALAVVLVVLIVGGYGMGWSWTGFPGNTLWDWLHLLLIPLTLPFLAHQVSERQKQRQEGAEGTERGGGTRATAHPAPSEHHG